MRETTSSPFTITKSEFGADKAHHTLRCGIEIWAFGPYAEAYRQVEPGMKILIQGDLNINHTTAN